jgi:hypothetical protein
LGENIAREKQQQGDWRAAIAQAMRFPCGNQAGTLRVAIIAV